MMGLSSQGVNKVMELIPDNFHISEILQQVNISVSNVET
jgi:hypothetical protein